MTGYVRPEDISRRNEITYDKIASARIFLRRARADHRRAAATIRPAGRRHHPGRSDRVAMGKLLPVLLLVLGIAGGVGAGLMLAP